MAHTQRGKALGISPHSLRAETSSSTWVSVLTEFAVGHPQTGHLVGEVFRHLPTKERKLVETKVAAVTDTELVTAVRPFMFGGKLVHELCFDPSKLLFFTKQEKVGAIVSAFLISCLAENGAVPLSDQTLRTHAGLIIRYAKRMKYGREVSLFLRRFTILEDEWRRDSFPQLSEDINR